jgi:hypothetical protein
MAGEWIKFENSLPEKPETLAITAAMGWTDPDLTVGKLMRLFRWFDQQTTDGNAARVTPALLDHVLGVTGLTLAVASVGWLTVNDEGLSLSKFDRHNGESAKQRAQTAKRVAKHKGNAKGNAQVTLAPLPTALPKEEKIREEKREEITTLSISQAQPEPTPGGRICKAMRQKGLADGNPSNPTLLALIAAGATDDEFIAAAQKAVAEQKGFAYAMGIVTGERKRAAALAQQIHHGELPAAATRPTFAQQAADIARTTVPARPGQDPTLAAIEQDAQRAAPPSAEQREKIKQLLRQRPAMATESDSK